MLQKNVGGVVSSGYKSIEVGENPLICSNVIIGE
jgi:hypothetical protein